MDDESEALGLLLVALILLAFYMIPAIVAFYRQHPNRWLIALVNFVFGCSVIGWFGSLIWAFHAFVKSPSGNNGGETGLNIFINDVNAGERQAISSDAFSNLTKLKSLFDQGVISESEFALMKQKFLNTAMQ